MDNHTTVRDALEHEIRDYDARLIREAERLVYLRQKGADWRALDAQVGFMDTLQAHRRGVLAEYARRGGKVRDLNVFGTHVDGEVTP